MTWSATRFVKYLMRKLSFSGFETQSHKQCISRVLRYGQRGSAAPLAEDDALALYWMQTRQPFIVKQHWQEIGLEWDDSISLKSDLAVPLFVGDELVGGLSLQNEERDNAFSDSDVRLLQTLANSMSVALENARLFDETQRLLKETEQRAAEFHHQPCAGRAGVQLDMQGIYRSGRR